MTRCPEPQKREQWLTKSPVFVGGFVTCLLKLAELHWGAGCRSSGAGWKYQYEAALRIHLRRPSNNASRVVPGKSVNKASHL
jgi:hypothetical protein